MVVIRSFDLFMSFLFVCFFFVFFFVCFFVCFFFVCFFIIIIIDSDGSRKEIASALNDFNNRLCKREYVEPNALKEWKVSIFKKVDKCIKFYSQNTNLLLFKHKSTFRHLKQGIQDLIESMFWFQQTRLQTTLLLFDGYIIY